MASKMAGMFLSAVILLSATTIGAIKHRFPTYYMEERCGDSITGYESARIEISKGLLYKRNMDCKLTIKVPNGVDIFLNFKRFSLEKPFKGKCVDYLDIYKGPPSALVRVNADPMCGVKIPWTMTVEASNLLLHFVSDRNADDMGFEIIYAASRTCLGLTNSTSLQCGDDGICLDQSLICDRVQQCPDGRDEKNCTVPVPQPDKRIPIIAGATVAGGAAFLLLVFLLYMLYLYIQEKLLQRRIQQIKLDDTYPITDLYRKQTFIGLKERGVRRRSPLGQNGHVTSSQTDVTLSQGGVNSVNVTGEEQKENVGLTDVMEKRAEPEGQVKDL